jgi:hypothetical protein
MLSTIIRSEDPIRMPHSYRGDVGEEDGNRRTPEQNIPSSSSSSNNDEATKSDDEISHSHENQDENGSSNNKHSSGPRFLTQEETIELARRAVENGILETKRSLAGSEAVSDVVKPKLTIDLGHSNIVRIPEAVVDAIKDEVERYVRLCIKASTSEGYLETIMHHIVRN